MMTNHDLANEYFSKFNLTVADLLKESPELGSDGVIMLIGSVSDGLATPLSDIDLLVVGERRPDSDLVLRESNRERAIRVLDSGQEINIEYWEKDRLRSIAEKFAKSVFAINNPALTDEIVVFDDHELRIIHYLINGIILSGSKRVFDDIFKTDDFIDYLVMFCAVLSHGRGQHRPDHGKRFCMRIASLENGNRVCSWCGDRITGSHSFTSSLAAEAFEEVPAGNRGRRL
ncbi:MAG: nucleotidyltransferase domain-containing protein [Sphingomonadales bacterium]|nr:nucleotidyltransferase domain-containing protein [Sphingomonadales bacterium]